MKCRGSSRLLLLAAMVLAIAIPAFAYLFDFSGSSSGPVMDRWDQSAFPIVWTLNPTTGSNISGSPVAGAIQASFNAWTSAPNTSLFVTRGADTTQTTFGADGVNLVCFVCQGDFSKDSSTLAVTFTTTANAGQNDLHGGTAKFNGQIVDADILFNPSVKFSVGSGSNQDLQTVATHEIGHFFGLDHSAVVAAMMFPFAPPLRHTLGYDDVAGISQLYPKAVPDVATGTISGAVTLNGGAVFGAHVYADSTTAGLAFGSGVRKTPIGTLTRPDGTYKIQGLPADSYTVTAEPLDEPVANSDVSGYPSAFGKSTVQTNFTTRWH